LATILVNVRFVPILLQKSVEDNRAQ